METLTLDLKALRGQLLEQEIRKAAADASLAELELVRAREEERDRLAKPGYNRILNIFDPLIPETVEVYIGALEHWERRGGDFGSITLNINSPGGSVMDGLALFDTIQRLRRKGFHVITRGTGLVASMATIILQAGDTRIADANVTLLIHELSGMGRGKISGIKDETAMMDKLNDRLLGILAERSTFTKRQIKTRADRREWYLDADEALRYGFVDAVE